MGGQNTKQSTNPNLPTNNNKKNNDDYILKHIKDSFRDCSSNGNLTKNQFNQALAVLETLNFKRLRDTPLADRLFVLFDKEKRNYISQNDFSNGIKDVISDKNHAIQFTFRAYDVDGDNRISKKQFTQLVQESWMTAFRLLAEYLDSNMKLSTKNIEEWAQSKISILNQESAKIFNRYDTNKKGFLQFQGFKELVLNAGINQIKAEIDNKNVIIPLTLIELNR